ncbi:response regulator [Pseudomonas sp. 22105]|uniref:response regulator n=1 Tax=unclassified Pseudomonas TaxID=196821 RepID=UPI003F8558A3
MELNELNILIIEDEPDFVAEIKRRVSSLCREPVFTVAAHAEAAAELLKNCFFDLVFLDLKLPTANESLDSDPQHGKDLLDLARTVAPGTPVFMLTGSSAEQFLPEMMALNHQVDIWGQGKTLSLIGFQPKHRVNNLDALITPYITACDAVCDVEINSSSDLDLRAARLVRIFTASVGGVFCDVRNLNGGLSGALVLKLLVRDGSGVKIHDSIAKIGSIDHIQDEVERHDKYISRLEPSATPRKVAVLKHGAKDTSGVFYSLASASELTGFSIVENGAEKVIKAIIGCLHRWADAATQKRVSIQSIRRSFISDEHYAEIRSLITHDWVERFEQNPVLVKWGCVHGDLHGMNILLSDNGIPVLIDYGDIEEGALCRDPVTFELSTFFHPAGPFKNSDWPNEEESLLWGQSEFSTTNCPAEEFFAACREWSESVAAGKRERAAVAYGYLVRQLKYPDCNALRVNQLLAGVKRLYDSA